VGSVACAIPRDEDCHVDFRGTACEPWALMAGCVASAKCTELFTKDRTATRWISGLILEISLLLSIVHAGLLSFGVKLQLGFANINTLSRLWLINLLLGVVIGVFAPLAIYTQLRNKAERVECRLSAPVAPRATSRWHLGCDHAGMSDLAPVRLTPG
jgi:hypothetical protein